MQLGQCCTRTLSKREEEILKLIGDGRTSKEIAVVLDISKETVSGYRKQLCKKLDLHSTASLVAYSVRSLKAGDTPSRGELTSQTDL